MYRVVRFLARLEWSVALDSVPVAIRIHRVGVARLLLAFGDPVFHLLPKRRDDPLLFVRQIFRLARILDQVLELHFGLEMEVGL